MAHLDLEPLLDQNIPWILDFQIQLPLDLRSLVPSSILRFHWTPPWMSPSVLVNHQENQAQHNPTGQRPLTCLHLPASLHHHNHNWTPSQLLTTSLQLLKTSEHIDDGYNNKRLCHLDLFEVVDKPLNQHLLIQHMVRAHTPSPRRTMEHPLFFLPLMSKIWIHRHSHLAGNLKMATFSSPSSPRTIGRSRADA